MWAQISLVRLTGENFTDDVAAWRRWWQARGGSPPIAEGTVDWPGGIPKPSAATNTTTVGAALKKVDFVVGPSHFEPGDKIVIKEVRSELGTLSVGDTVTVKGTYTLASHSRATLSFYITQISPVGPPDLHPGVHKHIEAGSGTFELTRFITSKGASHISFYPDSGSSGFGGVYFGTEAQMREYSGRGNSIRSAESTTTVTAPRGMLQSPNDWALNDSQRLYRDWSEDTYRNTLRVRGVNGVGSPELAVLEPQWIKQLSTYEGHDLLQPIASLAIVHSRSAVARLREIAADATPNENRVRWMAARALGLIGDQSAVPTLIPLLNHPNQNTRIWRKYRSCVSRGGTSAPIPRLGPSGGPIRVARRHMSRRRLILRSWPMPTAFVFSS